MSKVTIYGASDDLVEVEGDIRGADEYNTDKLRAVIMGSDGRELGVDVEFGTGEADWTIKVYNIYEPFPDWPIRFTKRVDRGDDPAVEIEVPEKSIFRVLSQ